MDNIPWGLIMAISAVVCCLILNFRINEIEDEIDKCNEVHRDLHNLRLDVLSLHKDIASLLETINSKL